MFVIFVRSILGKIVTLAGGSIAHPVPAVSTLAMATPCRRRSEAGETNRLVREIHYHIGAVPPVAAAAAAGHRRNRHDRERKTAICANNPL